MNFKNYSNKHKLRLRLKSNKKYDQKKFHLKDYQWSMKNKKLLCMMQYYVHDMDDSSPAR